VCPAGLPLAAGLGEPPDQLLFLGIDADHRLAGGQEPRGGGVDVAELGVPVGVLSAFEGLAGALQAEPGRAQDLRDHRVADVVSHRGELAGQVAGRLRGPPQRRLGVPAGPRLDERIQPVQQFRVGHLGFLTATTRGQNPVHPPHRVIVVIVQFRQTASDGRPRCTRRPMHRGNATASPRRRFGRQRQTPITLIEAYSEPGKDYFRTRRVAMSDGPLSGRIGFAHSTYRKRTVERVLYHRVLSL
jgi:hypothetical protein